MMLFAVCCTPRSGSTYLCQLMSSTGLMGYPDEYVHPDPKWGETYWRKRLGVEETDTRENYINALSQRRSTPNGFYGIKVTPKLYPLIKDRTTYHVWIRRRDYLRQAISLCKVSQTKMWGRRPSERKNLPVVFDAERIKKDVSLLKQIDTKGWPKIFREERVAPIEVFYEDLVENPLLHIKRIAEFMGLTKGIEYVSSETEKQADKVTEEWVAAFQK